jgi:hypothetical protein
MPYAPLNQRDRTAEKIPSSYGGFGACLGGGGFALLITVPASIILCLTSPIVNQIKKKKAEKKAARKGTEPSEDGGLPDQHAEKEQVGSPDASAPQPPRPRTPVVCQGECKKDPNTFCAVHNKKPEPTQTSGPSMLDT